MIHIKQELTQLAKPSKGRVRPDFWNFWHYGNFEVTGPKHATSWLGNRKGN